MEDQQESVQQAKGKETQSIQTQTFDDNEDKMLIECNLCKYAATCE